MEFVAKLEQVVRASIITQNTLNDLSKSVYFSSTYLRTLFRNCVGCTPHAYFTLLRMNKAQKLLLETELEIKEIAFICGFEDAKYFSRVFRDKEGTSPIQFRNSLKSKRQREYNKHNY